MKRLLVLYSILISLCVYGQNVNISNGVVFDGEPFISVNPTNTQHLVVAWMGWIDFSNQFKIKTKASFDGGLTWSADNTLPHTLSTYSSADPSIDFDQNGNVFVCYIDFTGTTPPVTGGVYLCKSSDGGLSWSAPLEVINTSYDGTKWPIDRPWMAIDRSNGPHQGDIYVTSMNLNRTNAPYNPYLSVSNDGGNTFTTRYLDTTGWLAGSLNPFPMCSPTVSSLGVFYGAYPSYVISQSFYIQSFLAMSDDGGTSVSHSTIMTFPANSFPDDTLAKKAALLLSNPADANHLAMVFLSTMHGDMDVFLIESMDVGSNWSAPIRINDDPIGNDRMQDLLWGDFDTDGDLVISWRDRRNGTDSTFQTESEIWAACRKKDSTQFESNFQITSETVAYDTILESAGTDFMCIKFQDDTLFATWGDTRDGRLNIWFQQMNACGEVLATSQIASEPIPSMTLYPNPTKSILTVKAELIEQIDIFDNQGKCVKSVVCSGQMNQEELNLETLKKGTYSIRVMTHFGERSEVIVKE